MPVYTKVAERPILLLSVQSCGFVFFDGKHSHLADVALNRVFGSPHGCCWPALAVNAVVRHTAVDLHSQSAASSGSDRLLAHVVFDSSFLGCVGQRLANGDFIAPGKSVDEGPVGANEQVCCEFLILEGTFDDGNTVKSLELLSNGQRAFTDMCPNFVSDCRSDPADGGSLPACSVDGDKHFVWHVNGRWHLGGSAIEKCFEGSLIKAGLKQRIKCVRRRRWRQWRAKRRKKLGWGEGQDEDDARDGGITYIRERIAEKGHGNAESAERGGRESSSENPGKLVVGNY